MLLRTKGRLPHNITENNSIFINTHTDITHLHKFKDLKINKPRHISE